MTLLLFYVGIALGFSFLCSLLEATLLTITPTQLQTAKSNGKQWALRLQGLKHNIDKPLSAILTLNTIAHTMGATGAGAQYTRVYGDATGGVFAAILTLLVLILSEIIPKTLGARYTLFFAPFTARALPIMEWGLRPVVWLCQGITRLITFGDGHAHPKHREELLAVARMGEEDGSIRKSESRIVRSMLNMSNVQIDSIMTPRPVMFTLSEEVTLQAFAEQIETHPFSRIPVYGDNHEFISGFVLRSDALQACLKDPKQPIASVKRKMTFVSKLMTVDALFRQMTEQRQHIAMVQDEYGSTVGLVTLEDALETLVGIEIVDEQDTVADLRKLAHSLWQQRAKEMGIKTDIDT
ncbi:MULTISPECIES: hemolysin family protein [unclassified Lentimonas]|uniref:hemolysin family protein n=1 Tax=unclassified Lentimonas TaxID=2630993 RepID=UPI0013218DFF|nr:MULTISPECIES: hemolysin family protein [unclassified Lentimonas]CAA6689636.1 Magnesium and cobalt efflux protein CorC [Lentimonas sp. CC19]CAA6692626.1 Magnesium and cobalt efflux protein CorC [Lentimonas sp. CC10]CAA7069227.1 Magnesium and cobalt efflux protein CorC [Lentimonas sp. CC11]